MDHSIAASGRGDVSSFYYKLFPDGGNGKRVYTRISDSAGTGLPETGVVICAPAAAFRFVSVPSRHTGADTAPRFET